MARARIWGFVKTRRRRDYMDTRVFLSECKEYQPEQVNIAVKRIFDEFGGAGSILGDGKKVLVKPNVLMPKKPEDAATTHPLVVESVCREFINAGADVTIIDSTGGPHTKFVLRLLYGKTGIKKAAKNVGAKASFDTSSRTVEYPEGQIIKKFDVLSPVLDADLVISLAKAKTHGFMKMTGCVKNLFGCIPGLGKPLLHGKYPKHEDFAAMLVDVCGYIKPGFSILDAVYGMEGAGPTAGNPKYVGAVLGGFSPFAVDLAQSYLMGMRADSIYTICNAAMRGLAPDTPESLIWLGDDPEKLRTSFKPARTNKANIVPKIMENCTGCGDCVRICPGKCMKIQKRKAIVDAKGCIRCYCCHEFCAEQAIEID